MRHLTQNDSNYGAAGTRLQPAEPLHSISTYNMNQSTRINDEEARGIVAALERKRKQLDEEIEKFRAEKDREYQLFEQLLRNQYKNKKRELDEISSTWPAQDQNSNSSALPGIHEAGYEGSAASKARAIIDTDGRGRSLKRQAHNENMRSTDKNDQQRLSIQLDHLPQTFMHDHPESYTPTHDRETEFRGLFTPSYLPLLDSRSRSREKIKQDSSNSSSNTVLFHPRYQDHNTPFHNGERSTSEPNSVSHSPLSVSPPTDSLPSTLAPSRPPILYRSLSSTNTLVSALRNPLKHKSKPKKRVSIRIDDMIVLPNQSIEDGSSANMTPSKLSPPDSTTSSGSKPMFTIGPDDSSSESGSEEMIEDTADEQYLGSHQPMSRSETPISPLDLNEPILSANEEEEEEERLQATVEEKVEAWKEDVEKSSPDEGPGMFLMDEEVDSQETTKHVEVRRYVYPGLIFKPRTNG
ncbi:MAG: hypothetical protein M1834_002145 [Cirrosporium novae-zelandiae]|nr:MAG: hypothetical protein M1834_002145 [Cirrosporium novae-zelandiae]